MRVLTVVGDLGAGGTQRAAQNYTIGYKQARCEAAVLAITAGGPRAEVLKQADIAVFMGGKLPEEQSIALRCASGWKPDIIHIHRRGFADPQTAYILKELKTSKNRVLETNVFSRVDYSPDSNLIDVHLHLSRWCLWKWSQWARGISPTPIGAVVPYIIDSQSFYPASLDIRAAFRDAYGIPQEAFLFGRIGQPILPKWSPIIFTAFAEVAQRHQNAYLLLVGLPNELRSILTSLAEDVQKRIIEISFLHGDENLRTCYSAMDVFLHAANIGESFGMVLVEAMLCGCPVITLSTSTKDNSQLEVVGHERGGLVVTNQRSMVEAMIRVMQNNQLRQHLAKKGAEWVKNQYDIFQAMPTLLKIAAIALASDTQNQLRTAFQNEPNIVTKVDWSEIQKLLYNTIGKTSIKEHLLMRLVHNPWLYRLYSQRLK